MADSSLIAALLSPTAAAEMERRRQEEAGQVSSNPFAKLLTESAKTAGGLRSSLGGLFGTELRNPAQIRQAGMVQAIQSAEGATLKEKLQNALPTIGKIDPAVAIQLESKIKELGPQMTYKDIRMGTREVTEPPKFPGMPATTKVVSNIRTGVFQNGNLIGYLGDDGQVIRLNSEEAKQIQQAQEANDKSTGVMKGDKEPPRPIGETKDTVIDMGDGARLVRKEDLEQPAEETKTEEKTTPATTATPSTSGQMKRRGGPVSQEGETVAEIQSKIVSLQTRLDNTRNPRARKALQDQIKKLEAQLPEGAVAPAASVADQAQVDTRVTNRPTREYPNVPTEPGQLTFELPAAGGARVLNNVTINPNPDGTISLNVGGNTALPITPKQLADRGLGVRGNQVVVINEDLYRKAIANASKIATR